MERFELLEIPHRSIETVQRELIVGSVQHRFRIESVLCGRAGRYRCYAVSGGWFTLHRPHGYWFGFVRVYRWSDYGDSYIQGIIPTIPEGYKFTTTEPTGYYQARVLLINAGTAVALDAADSEYVQRVVTPSDRNALIAEATGSTVQLPLLQSHISVADADICC